MYNFTVCLFTPNCLLGFGRKQAKRLESVYCGHNPLDVLMRHVNSWVRIELRVYPLALTPEDFWARVHADYRRLAVTRNPRRCMLVPASVHDALRLWRLLLHYSKLRTAHSPRAQLLSSVSFSRDILGPTWVFGDQVTIRQVPRKSAFQHQLQCFLEDKSDPKSPF